MNIVLTIISVFSAVYGIIKGIKDGWNAIKLIREGYEYIQEVFRTIF